MGHVHACSQKPFETLDLYGTSISGHANLQKAISVAFVVGGLIFKGLREVSQE